MNTGLVDLDFLRQNINNTQLNGKNGFGFKIDNKFVKVYARESDKGFFEILDVSKIEDLSKFTAKTIVFPEKYIYENGQKAGEISRFINSKNLNLVIDSIKIKPMIDSYEKVLEDLYLYDCINMIDLCYVNILYSNKSGFHIIDTTEWQIKNGFLNENIRRFNSSLLAVIVDEYEIPIIRSKYYSKIDKNFYSNIAKYGKCGQRLQHVMELLLNNENYFLDFIFAFQDVYRIHYGEELEKLKEMHEMTKVLKKG